jgi:hypothetical protein
MTVRSVDVAQKITILRQKKLCYHRSRIDPLKAILRGLPLLFTANNFKAFIPAVPL